MTRKSPPLWVAGIRRYLWPIRGHWRRQCLRRTRPDYFFPFSSRHRRCCGSKLEARHIGRRVSPSRTRCRNTSGDTLSGKFTSHHRYLGPQLRFTQLRLPWPNNINFSGYTSPTCLGSRCHHDAKASRSSSWSPPSLFINSNSNPLQCVVECQTHTLHLILELGLGPPFTHVENGPTLECT